MLDDVPLFVYVIGFSIMTGFRTHRLRGIAVRTTVLTPGELLMHRLHEQLPGAMIVVGAARIQGPLTFRHVESLCRELQLRHPALRASIHGRGQRCRFEVSESPNPIPITWEQASTTEAWCDAAIALGRIPFQSNREPLLRMHVVEQPSTNSSDVIVACHHAICDGQSLAAFFADFVRLADGRQLPASEHAMRPLPHVPRTRGVWGPFLEEGARRVRLRRRLRKHPLAPPPWGVESHDVLRRRVWTSAGTAALAARAREEQTTVFGALVAAYLAAIWHKFGFRDQSIRFRTPVDLRSRCIPRIPRDVLGCYATMLELTLVDVGSQEFWELARLARAELDRQLENGAWASAWHLLRWVLNRGWRIPVQPTLCGISNLGVVELPSVSEYSISEMSWTVNQRGLSNNMRLSCATVGGALNLTLRSPWHTPDEVEELLEDIVCRLGDASGVSRESAAHSLAVAV